MIHLGIICLSVLGAMSNDSSSAQDVDNVSNEALWAPQQSLAKHPLERELIRDAADGVLESHTLLEASLVAAGHTDRDEIESLVKRFGQILEHIQPPEGDEMDQAKHLLQEMHRVVMVGHYDATCSDIRHTIQHGDYNCVSATIIYQIICNLHGIDVGAVAVPAHVFSQLKSQGVDVQTTCDTWLQSGKGRESAKETEPRRALQETQLVGKIYYNRGVMRLHSNDFAEAIRVLRLSLELDKDDAIANNNLLAAINNWSLAEANSGRFGSASELLSVGRSLDPVYAPLLANDLHIHQRWVQTLCRDGRYAFAIRVLQDGLRRQPKAKLFDDGRYIVLRLWVADAWKEGRLEDGFAALDQGATAGGIQGLDVSEPAWSPRRIREAEIAAATAAASHLAAHGRRSTAIRLVTEIQRRGDASADKRVAEILENLLLNLTHSRS